MKLKLFYIALALLILGASFSFINFIPSWVNTHAISVFIIFFITIIVGIIYLIRQWKYNFKNKSSLNLIDWIKSIITSVTLIIGIPLLSILSTLQVGEGIMEASLEKEIFIGEDKIFLYYNECFPPDNVCECDNYHSLVYKKNKYLPIKHLIMKVDFYIGDIQLNDGELIVWASDKCQKDIGKSKTVNF